MKSEVRLTLAGEERLLACPLGAIEEIARVEPKLRQALDDLTNELCAFILPLVMVEMGSRCSFHSWTDQRRARAWLRV